MEAIGLSTDDLYRILLIMFRAGALLMTVPVFGHVSIPRQLRVWIVIILALVIFPSAAVSTIPLPTTTFELVLVILTELAIGFSIGFTVVLLFAGVQFAGHLTGLNMGLAMASIVDPMGSGQISVIGEFYYLVSLLIFLMIDGHHFVIEALVRSYEMIPVSGGAFSAELGEFLMALTGNLFIIGIKISAPVIITLFIVNIVLGIVARTVPQMNVFIVGFPLSIGVGLVMIYLSMPYFETVFIEAYSALKMDIRGILILLGR